MPELPEVETIRRMLQAHVVGRRVRRVHIVRSDVISGPRTPAALLRGRCLSRIDRHGKQLALVGIDATGGARCLVVHLGMTGRLHHAHGPVSTPDSHVHVRWHLDDGALVSFRDPRRFGGLWPSGDPDLLWQQRWRKLGPDALTIRTRALAARLTGRVRPLKSALLDQHVIAGLGNIYVDELLGDCCLHPRLPCRHLRPDQIRLLAHRTRRLLRRANSAGGSTFRDYRDPSGRPGRFQDLHHFYGRAGLPCRRCGRVLSSTTIAGRTTVYCARCQAVGPAVSSIR